jgi:hypothetical protein
VQEYFESPSRFYDGTRAEDCAGANKDMHS